MKQFLPFRRLPSASLVLFIGTLWLSVLCSGCKKDAGANSIQPVDTASTVSLAQVFQNNMVIQRDKPVTVWGQAPLHTTIALNASWDTATYTTQPDASGNWSVTLSAAAANALPQTLSVKATGYPSLTVGNILLGDVWLCSGQSNMVMPMTPGAPFQGVLDYHTEIAAASYPNIRMLTITPDDEPSPRSKFLTTVNWNVCSPATAGAESSVAYYFARKLNSSINVPIGIIVAAVTGSLCQQWANADAIRSSPLLTKNYLTGSSGYYNGMINPLTKTTLKGFIWYQGESNVHDYSSSAYSLLNAALIQGWRNQFNQPGLPFYYVQIAPYGGYSVAIYPPRTGETDFAAFFREAQANLRGIISGTGMATTIDVGDPGNIHPRNKKPVGERLALLALNDTYGQNVQSVGPQYAFFSSDKYTATVSFIAGTADGLCTSGNTPLSQCFFVAGTDQVFRPAVAAIAGNTIVITAPPSTPLPIKALRYAFSNAPAVSPNLQNADGLPAEPFRTDKWAQ